MGAVAQLMTKYRHEMATPKYIAICLLPALLIGCKKPSANLATSDEGNQRPGAIIASASARKIITKDQAYVAVLKEPDGDELLKEYSDGYNSRGQEIEATVATISDPDLRDRVRKTEWAGVDEAKFREQANAKFLQTRLAVLDQHQNDWFEIGHVEYPGSDTLYIHYVDASPVTFVGAATMAMDVASIDQIYSRFRIVAHDGIEAEALYKRSGRDKSGHFSVETDPQVVAIAERAAEATLRVKRLVMVGQGDLVAHRLDKLMLVDYDTETVLAEFPPTSLHADDFHWRFDTKTAEDLPFQMTERTDDAPPETPEQ
jgi:hypothetical protein